MRLLLRKIRNAYFPKKNWIVGKNNFTTKIKQ